MHRFGSGRRVGFFGSLLLFALVLPARAGVDFARTTVNVGEVRCGAPLAHRFVFINRTKAPVEIVDLKTTCGCLTPTVSQKTLQPSDEGSVLLEVNTLTQPAGAQDWWVKLYYRADDELQETTLHILARLVEEIRVEPATLAIYADQAVQHVLTLIDTRAEPLSIKAVSATSPCLQTAIGKTTRNDKGEWSIPIQLKFSGDIPDGRHQETISICTGDPSYPELRVAVTLVKEEHNKVTAAPSFVNIRAAADRPLPSRIVILRNSGDEMVEVERLTADDPAIQCTWAPGPDNNATIKLTVDRKKLKGDHLFGKVQIELRRPKPQTLTLPVECLIE